MMSWLWLKGEKIHCSECESSVEIYYEDAPRFVQVGDINVVLQRQLNERYNEPGDGFDSKTAMFFHVVGICENCLQHMNIDLYYIPEEDINYKKILDEYELLHQSFNNSTNQIVRDFLNSIQGNLLDEIIKKSIQINPTTKNNQNKRSKQIISERKQYIVRCLSTYFEKYKEKTVLEGKFKNDFQEFQVSIQQYFNTCSDIAVILKPYDYLNIRTLNPIISNPESRAKPKKMEYQPLHFYIDQGYTLEEFRCEIVDHIEHNKRKIPKSIRKVAADKFSELEEILLEFGIDDEILRKEHKVYICLVDGNYEQAIIQCNECGIAYRKNSSQTFEHLPSGAIDRVKSPYSKYANCVCEKCFELINERQSRLEFAEIKELINNIESQIIPKYQNSVKRQYQNYVVEFSEYDLEALKSGKQIALCNENEIVKFLDKRKNRVVKKADGYVRSKTRIERNELIAAVNTLNAKFCVTNEGAYGLYELYESDAKIKLLRVNDNSFYPYKKFTYKDDYQKCMDFDLSHVQDQCHVALLEKIKMMVIS